MTAHHITADSAAEPLPLARLLSWILLLWAIANFGPHLIVRLVFGEPYFGLPMYLATPIEVGLMVLNLVLPLWWLHRRGIPWPAGLAWQRSGRQTWLWGLGGLALVLVMGWATGRSIGAGAVAGDQGRSYGFPEILPLLAALLGLWVAAVAGEEVMFRGWMQTQLAAHGPVWLSVALPALLFGLRHLPLDLYQGHAGTAGWAARLLELYGLALIMGLIRWRTGSIVPTVVLHAGLWWLVVVGVYGTGAGAVAGVILGVGVAMAALAAERGGTSYERA
jgi:membrane protease YdiL (CAAX protease family)